ncbi:hypothetical protein RJJ64_33155, partial [Rhizobium hidalgonense]|nr:hypothetical protein [Rhizobium hidalgonense]
MLNVGPDILGSLEERLALHLRSMATGAVGSTGNAELQSLAQQSNDREKSLGEAPIENAPFVLKSSRSALESALPLCELLVDCYLAIGDAARSDQEAERARNFAAQVIHCL